MDVLTWARSVKPDLLTLQQQTGIPALWAAGQMCHESAIDSGANLSALAREHHNYAGLKAARWQRAYGCGAVSMKTWEHIDGQDVDLTDAFCSCPSWEVWLQVYSDLLTSGTYKGALSYREDPMLYGIHVWQSGWATDPAYIAGVAGWMSRLFAAYADTLPGGRYKPVIVRANGETVDCGAVLAIDRTLVRIRPVLEKLGHRVEWDETTYTVDIDKDRAL